MPVSAHLSVETPQTPSRGRRVADRPVDASPLLSETSAPAYVGRRRAAVPASVEVQTHQAEIVSDRNVAEVLAALVPVDHTTSFHDEHTSKLTLVRPEPEPEPTTYVATSTPGQPAIAGKRRATKHAGSRGPLFKALPSTPILVGIATLAITIGGVLTAQDETPVNVAAESLTHASALTGASGIGKVISGERSDTLTRDSSREALGDATDGDLLKEATDLAEQRDAALADLANQAEQQAKVIAKNLWQYPLNSVHLTARFGQYGLWSSYHTGLDFNGNNGDPIMAIANGVVTEVGYDGSYGNKTVVTLEDGTEIWYCHQSGYAVSVGDTVRGGEVIGLVGSTGNVTGSHLHVEVRPGGGDPVDPYAAMQQHGLFR